MDKLLPCREEWKIISEMMMAFIDGKTGQKHQNYSSTEADEKGMKNVLSYLIDSGWAKNREIGSLADLYYQNASQLPENVKSRLSLYQLREVFDKMVKPSLKSWNNPGQNTRTPQAPDELLEALEWRPIETAPKWEQVLLFREDAGVFTGAYTCVDEFLADDDKAKERLTEDEVYQDDWFFYGAHGLQRLEGDELPTHWMHLPNPPQALSKYQKPKDRK